MKVEEMNESDVLAEGKVDEVGGEFVTNKTFDDSGDRSNESGSGDNDGDNQEEDPDSNDAG